MGFSVKTNVVAGRHGTSIRPVTRVHRRPKLTRTSTTQQLK